MQKSGVFKKKWLWSVVLLLFLGIVATFVVLANKFFSYLPDDTGAIPLISENAVLKNANEIPASPSEVKRPEETVSRKPGFEASDENAVWSTHTEVEIFRISYANGEQTVTVNSGNGDSVIAPGTKNSYTFKLKNTGDTAMDYAVFFDAYFEPGDIAIPVTGRISRYDGAWLAGDKKTYVGAQVLDQAEDRGALRTGHYCYYTLDWLWPFESGADERDTLLGDRAVNEDLTFTVVIRTIASESKDADAAGGLEVPETGDSSKVALWMILLLGSLSMLLLFALFPGRKKRSHDAEENEFERD